MQSSLVIRPARWTLVPIDCPTDRVRQGLCDPELSSTAAGSPRAHGRIVDSMQVLLTAGHPLRVYDAEEIPESLLP